MTKIYDLADVVGWAEKAIEANGAGWIHSSDPNRPEGASAGDCYNAFKIGAACGESDYVPGCIIGRMLVDAGLTTSKWLYNHAASVGIGGTIQRLESLTAVKHEFTESAMDFMSRLQSRQDSGRTWGESLEMAIEGTSNLRRYMTDNEKKFLDERKV